MRQAYLITAYKDFGILYDLAGRLCESGYVFIHVDQKSKTITDENIATLCKINRCRAIRAYSISWGGFNHVKAITLLMTMALEHEDISYVHLLTGEDYPVVSPAMLDQKFVGNDKIYMDYMTPKELPETVTVRYKYYNLFQDKNVKNKVLWKIQDLTCRAQKKIGIERNGIGEFNQIYKGLVYISMPFDVTAFIIRYLAKHGQYWEDLKACQVPEEFFFQTLIMNTPSLKARVEKRELRYMDWSRTDGASPAYLRDSDYDKIMQSGCVFARKFSPVQSAALRERIRKQADSQIEGDNHS